MGGIKVENQNINVALIITALSEERKAVIEFLADPKPGKDNRGASFIYGYYPSKAHPQCWKIICPAPSTAGNVKAAAKTALNLDVRPELVVFVGVAGGFPGKVNLYDVVVAERVYYVEPGKIDTEGNYLPRPDQHKATATLLTHAQTLQDLPRWEQVLRQHCPNEKIEVWVEPIVAGEKLAAASKSAEMKRI